MSKRKLAMPKVVDIKENKEEKVGDTADENIFSSAVSLINFRKNFQTMLKNEVKSIPENSGEESERLSSVNSNRKQGAFNQEIKKDELPESPKSRKIRKNQLITKITDSIIFLLILLDIAISNLENNIFTKSTINAEVVTFTLTDEINNMRWLLIGVCFLIGILLVFRYFLNLRLLRLRELASNEDGLISTGLFKWMILELIFLLVFSPPYVIGTFTGTMLQGTYTYSYDTIINFVII